jgi:hypothetical protein
MSLLSRLALLLDALAADIHACVKKHGQGEFDSDAQLEELRTEDGITDAGRTPGCDAAA